MFNDMWSLINPDYIGFYMLCSVSLGVVTAISRYRIEKDKIFWDGSTYFLLLTYLYVSVPAYVHLNTGVTLIDASMSSIVFAAQYSLYFTAVLTIYYVLKSVRLLKKRAFAHSVSRSVAVIPINNNILYFFYLIILVYVASVFFINFPGLSQLWSDRAFASVFKTEMNNVYKITMLFAVTVTMVAYLVIKNRKMIYVLMFAPFVVMDLLTTDRVFLYQTLLITIGMMLLIDKKIPLVKFAVAGLFTISIEVMRTIRPSDLDLTRFIFIPGELLYTADAGLMIIESQMSINYLELIAYSFGKALSPQLMAALFSDMPHFSRIIHVESQLQTGLGGSFLSEVFSLKNNFLLIIYPFVTISYLVLINKIIARRVGFFSVLIFLFFLMSTHTFFRGGLIYVMMEPIYYTLYAGAWYWIISSLAFRRATR